MIRRVVGLALLALVLVACGRDDGDDADAALVGLLQDEADWSEQVATCIADRLADEVDREASGAIIRGEGTTDVDTANVYSDTADACDPGSSDATTDVTAG